MLLFKIIFFTIMVMVVFVNLTYGHVDNILKTDYNPESGEAISPDKMFQFMTGGVPQIFWTFVNSSHFNKVNFIGSSCKKSLLAVSRGLEEQSLTAYKFVDSSGKTPAGLIRATMSSFGDFDECLSIDEVLNEVNVVGKYCAYDTFPVRTSNNNSNNSTSQFGINQFDYFSLGDFILNRIPKSPINTLHLDQVTVFKGLAFLNSICLPSQCSTIEVKHLLSTGKLVFEF